ncbi:MAG: T9SS type A sorting domain-containing protein [Bacteroidales bacterium]|nr:T9SS type A sorting domain-containing protein [Bacteroidales bacterium]
MKKLKNITSIFILIAFISISLNSMSQPWTWHQSQLTYARMGLTATILDDSIFYSPGKTSNTFSNIVDIYDIGEDQWDTVIVASAGRWTIATVSAGGKVFMAGGNNFPGTGNFTDVDVFDKATGEWSVDSLSLGRAISGGAVACGNKVFFAGGHIHPTPSTTEYTNVIDIYDTDTDTWTIDYLSIPRCFIGAVAVGGKVYFAGGAIGEQEVTNVIDIYDTITGTWSEDTLSEKKAVFAAVAYGDKIYFAGGAQPYAVTSTLIEVYNTATSSWEDTMNLQASRIVTALKVKNSLVFTGAADWMNFTGPGYIGPPNGVVEIYYPETNQWDYTVPNLTPARWAYGWVSYVNKAYYCGGYSGSPVNTISVLEYDGHCLPDGITFTTQEGIDNFQSNYPGCIEIEGDVIINGDDIADLDGLEVLMAIGGNLSITGNDVLSDLTGLQNVMSIDGHLEIISNPILTELTGLDNIEAASISDLSIYYNFELSECDIWNICYYINTTSGTIDIHDNATECNSIEEVQEHCLTEIEELIGEETFTISPNPLNSTTLIKYTLNQNSPVTIKIIDLTGQEIVTLVDDLQQQGEQQVVFNTSGLPTGIYFCVLKTKARAGQTKKIIKL